MDKDMAEKIEKTLKERAERIQRAGKPGSTPMSEECRKPAEPPKVTVTVSPRIPEKKNKATSGFQSWRKQKVSWSSVTYLHKEFRETCIRFDSDKNLSRFVWRTAKLNGMDEITLSDVQKMLEAADETIWILGDTHAFRAEDPDKREPTWVVQMDRKKCYAALMRITEAGWATTELRDITIKGEQMKQRVWTLRKEQVKA